MALTLWAQLLEVAPQLGFLCQFLVMSSGVSGPPAWPTSP